MLDVADCVHDSYHATTVLPVYQDIVRSFKVQVEVVQFR